MDMSPSCSEQSINVLAKTSNNLPDLTHGQTSDIFLVVKMLMLFNMSECIVYILFPNRIMVGVIALTEFLFVIR
jgi:hypothetical protein